MRRAFTYLLSIIAMIFFSYITTYYQQYASMIFLGYFVLIMAIMMIAAGKSASKVIKDINYIQESEKILEVDSETVRKLKEKDYLVFEEEKTQYLASLLTLIPMILIMAIFLIKWIRDALLQGARSIVVGFVPDEQLATFASWLMFYSLFFLIAQGSYLFTRIYFKMKKITPLTVASTYTIREKGLIIDNRLPLKFPLKNAKLSVNTKRKFVELELRGVPSPSMPTQQTSRIRLYASNPKEIYKILKDKVTGLSEQSR